MKKSLNLLRDDIKYSVHCDERGNVIGPISKEHAHLDGVRSVLCHFSTWSMIYNPLTGKYGIQLKNPKKHDKYSAGKWDMGVAGHNQYVKNKDGISYLGFKENLAKEAKEEIGIDIKVLDSLKDFLNKYQKMQEEVVGYIFEEFHYKTEINNEYVGLGLILANSEIVSFTDNEVIDFRWLKPSELKNFLKENSNYCEPLLLVLKKVEKFRKKYLI